MKNAKIKNTLPTLLIVLSGCSVNVKTRDIFEFRYYVIHTNFTYVDDFYIELRGSGVDNQFLNYQSNKCLKSFEINDSTKDYCICYFDIPSSIESAVFYSMKINSKIGDYGHSDFFEINYKDMLVCETNGYSFANAKTVQSFYTSSSFFASYIVSSLDVNSDSFCNGFNSYDYLNDVFYKEIIAHEGKDAFDNYTWYDDSMNRNVSFNEKWNLIRDKNEEYIKNTPNKFKGTDVVCLIFGIFLLALCLFALTLMIVILIVKRKRGNYA